MSLLESNTNLKSDVSDFQPSYKVKRLQLTNFRNYSNLEINVCSSCVVMIGPNGAGKTNILEALSLLSPGRGIRRSKYDELSKNGTNSGWAVSARLSAPGIEDDYLVGTGTITELSGNTYSKRNLKINSEKKSLMSLSEITCFSWLTPQMDRLFQGETVTRRRFIDRLVYTLDPNHGKRVTSYEKLIRERSNLLKSNNFSGEWLSAIENSISEFGVAIAAGRKSMIAHLNSELINKKGVFLGARLDIEGYLENLLNHKPAIEVEDIFRDKLLNSRKTDAERGRTTSGPHRSDLIVYNLKNNLPASLCSTGEQKSLLIAIILAEAKIISSIRGGAPILLLDEIAAHLDSEHIKSLFEELRMLNSQIWITTTNKSLLEFIVPDFEVLNIINGTVEQIN
ncbi:DNA replication/repair protein RecF [Alphaproteobacteria bacterium]|nr:DNA replication/repair protein RecF [Alphaproteobacteria bacterium]